MSTRQAKSLSRKKHQKKIKRIILWSLFALVAVTLGSAAGWGYTNVHIRHKVEAQYATVDRQRFLKTNVAAHTIQRVRTDQAHWSWLLTPTNRQKVKQLLQDYTARQQRDHDLDRLMDGKNYYRDGVNVAQLNRLDQRLLKEKNQTVYQRQKNRLDTVQVWVAQTNDGNQFIGQVYQTFQQDKQQLTQEKVSEADVYYRLLKNRKIIAHWRQPIKAMDASFTELQKEKNQNQAAADKKAIEDFKNAPLTVPYTPAKVTIDSGNSRDEPTNDRNPSSSSGSVSSNALTQALNDAGITASRLLVLDSDANSIFIAQRSGSVYNVSGSRYSVVNNNLDTGTYRIRATIQSPGADAGVITDPDSSQFGTYFTTPPSQYQDADNSTSDFNSATPVFWLKNQPALSSSILVASGGQLGFITSGSLSSENVVRVSSSSISGLIGAVNSGMVFAVI
ncbi:hypothetical protein ACNAN0_12275 [Agrilactobacillus fermenti]